MMTAIAGVSIVNTFVGRICGYGTVWVNGSGARRALIAVQNPKAFSQAVYARLDDSKLTKGTAAYNPQRATGATRRPTANRRPACIRHGSWLVSRSARHKPFALLRRQRVDVED
jgi:hypothetical protein